MLFAVIIRFIIWHGALKIRKLDPFINQIYRHPS